MAAPAQRHDYGWAAEKRSHRIVASLEKGPAALSFTGSVRAGEARG